jgi:hypothetical protein
MVPLRPIPPRQWTSNLGARSQHPAQPVTGIQPQVFEARVGNVHVAYRQVMPLHSRPFDRVAEVRHLEQAKFRILYQGHDRARAPF